MVNLVKKRVNSNLGKMNGIYGPPVRGGPSVGGGRPLCPDLNRKNRPCPGPLALWRAFSAADWEKDEFMQLIVPVAKGSTSRSVPDAV